MERESSSRSVLERNKKRKQMDVAKTRGTQARNRKPFVSAKEQALRVNATTMKTHDNDNVGTYLHLLLCKKHHLQCSDKRYTHKSTHTHVRTHHNHSREITNIKFFGISLFKQIKSQIPGYQTQFVSTSKRECQIIAFAIPADQNIAIK